MKNKLLFLGITFILLLSLVSNGYSQSCNCLPGWPYVTQISINNANARDYTDFEICDTINTLALISAGKMKADGGDIRFTDMNCNPLHYYVESGINTASTIIWVNVNNIPANSTKTIYMFYGNPAATSQSTARKTFSFYEGFDNNTLGRILDACGSGPNSTSVIDGVATFTYEIDHLWCSDMVFPVADAYTVEANVTAVTPRPQFPGLWWAKEISRNQKMGLTMFDKAAIMGTNSLNDPPAFCGSSLNFIGPQFFAHFPAGLWSFTWVARGSQVAGFPANGGYVTWNTTDSFLVKDEPLRILIGAPAGGTGNGTTNISMDWIRARKYAVIPLLAVNGGEISAPKSPGNSLSSTVLGSNSIRINWADSSDNEAMFMIERSLDQGTNWTLRDSVPANTTQYTDLGLTANTEYCYRVYATNCMAASAFSNMTCATTALTGVNITGNEIPQDFNMYQNYPNPFNPVTNIKFDIPKQSFVRITIFDALGRKMTELVSRQLSPGSYTADWNGDNYASGIYFYRIEAGDYVREMKMVLLK